MASMASQLIQEVTAHVQSDSLEDAREICADGTYFPNNQRILDQITSNMLTAICNKRSRNFPNIQQLCTQTTPKTSLKMALYTS